MPDSRALVDSTTPGDRVRLARRLEFAEPKADALASVIAAAAGRSHRVEFAIVNDLAREVARRLRILAPQLRLESSASDMEPGFAAPGDEPATVVAVCEPDADRLAVALAAYVDRAAVTVIAPVTDRFWSRRSLFLISIPKAGTHLLMELARAFGYRAGAECPPNAMAGAWHYVEYTNSHTAATDFFIDTVRRQPHGNRDHPFPHHPSLFIYRNPLDIVSSEANYYQEDGATVFAGYLDGLSYEQRLLRLIDDPWLMGSIRDRVAKFVAWLDVGSVIPVSFEELVGPAGGGDASVQLDLIWSLMLRLQIPGDPAAFAATVFNPNSPTFRFGKIGGHEQRFTDEAWQKFRALDQDFMAACGFASRPASGPWLPTRAAEFRRRVPHYSKAERGVTPILVRQNVEGHNIVRYRGRFWAVPHGFEFSDLTRAPEHAFERLASADDQATLEFGIHAKSARESTRSR